MKEMLSAILILCAVLIPMTIWLFGSKRHSRLVITGTRTHLTDGHTGPRTVRFSRLVVPRGYKVSAIGVDNKYNVTDVGIAAGEDVDGWTKELSVWSSLSRKKVLALERNTLVKAATALGWFFAKLPQYTYDAVSLCSSDTLPTTTVAHHAFFEFRGNFPGGIYRGTWSFNQGTDEWGAATALTADIGCYLICNKKQRNEVYETVQGKLKANASDLTILNVQCAALFTTIANISQLIIGKQALSTVGYEQLKREWLIRQGTAWNGTLSTTSIGWTTHKRQDVKVTLSTATDTYYVIIRPLKLGRSRRGRTHFEADPQEGSAL